MSTSDQKGTSSPKLEGFVNLLKAPNKRAGAADVESIPLKKLTYNNGVPRIQWTEVEVNRIHIMENLQFAIVGKFSYGWPEMEELRSQISKQCNIKRDCIIGLLRNRHILIKFDREDDFVNILSKNIYYIEDKEGFSYSMRPLIYDVKFKVEEETTQALAWISFSKLKPAFFCKGFTFFDCIDCR